MEHLSNVNKQFDIDDVLNNMDLLLGETPEQVWFSQNYRGIKGTCTYYACRVNACTRNMYTESKLWRPLLGQIHINVPCCYRFFWNLIS